jgi:hypothetical protein
VNHGFEAWWPAGKRSNIEPYLYLAAIKREREILRENIVIFWGKVDVRRSLGREDLTKEYRYETSNLTYVFF